MAAHVQIGALRHDRRCTAAIAALALLFLALSVTSPASAQTSEPEIEVVGAIDFQMRVTYRYAANIITQVLSNRVSLSVRAYHEPLLSVNGDRAVMPGGSATFVYTLTNRGNVVDTFKLDTELPPGMTAQWWYDLDGNGRYSPADAPLVDTNGDGRPDSGPMSPGDTRQLLLRVSVPATAKLDIHSIQAKATSVGNPAQTAAAQSRLEVTDSAPYISIEGAPAHVYEGHEFIVPIRYGNTGTHPVQGLTITMPLSPYVTFVTASPEGVYDAEAHQLTWSIGTLGPEVERTLHVRLRALEGQGSDKTIHHLARLKHAGSLVLESQSATQLATRSPASIVIVANPSVIRADGKAVSRLMAAVTDMVGNPVENQTRVIFRAPVGDLRPATADADVCSPEEAGGGICLSALATNGVAQVDLVAPRIDSNEHTVVPVTVSAWNPDTGEVTERLDMYFSPGAIVGRLLDMATGYPETGVEVRLVRLNAAGNPVGSPTVRYTDENGYYIFPVPEGAYRLVVIRNTPNGPAEFELPQIEVSEAFDSVTFPPVIIRGRLIDRQSGLGVANATVDLFNESNVRLTSATTNELGDYTFIVTQQDIAAAAAQAAANSGGFAIQQSGAQQFAPMNVTSQEATVQGILNRPTWRVQARTADGRGAEMSIQDVRPGDMVVNLNLLVEPLGRVFDKVTGQPVAGASVYLMWAGPPFENQVVSLQAHHGLPQLNPMPTAADGTYRFVVSPGYYKLVVDAQGYLRYESEPMMLQGNQVAMILHIEPAGSDRIAFTKEALHPYRRVGENAIYALQVQNRTSEVIPQVSVVDKLPPELAYIPGSANAGAAYDPVAHTLSWSIQNLAPQQTALLHYETEVGGVPAGTVLTNTARAQVAGEAGFELAMADIIVADWPAMFLRKRADQSEASIGDVVRYEVFVENRSEANGAFVVAIEDRLPVGFQYVAGSSNVDGVRVPDPLLWGDSLVWPLGDMAPQTAHTLTYATVVTLEATESDGVNTAYVLGEAAGGHAFRIGPSTAYTRVLDGLFGYEGRIIGRVFIDMNGDGQPDPGEPGLHGVEVVLDDGRIVTTGNHGFFAIESVEPGVRSVKLAAVSLPHGVGPGAHGTLGAQGGEYVGTLGGWSHFAAVRPSAVAWVDFAVPAGSGAADVELPQVDAESLLAYAVAHIIEQDGGESAEHTGLPRISAPGPYEVSYRRLATVTIEGHRKQPLTLLANGVPVPEHQIGRRVDDGREGRLTLTYYGVELQEGRNVLTAISGDGRHEMTVLVVGRPAGATLLAQPDVVPFRNERHVPVTVLVTDALGIPVEDGTVVTVSAIGGRALSRDTHATRPGVQLETKGGLIHVLLGVQGRHDGPITVQIESGEAVWELPVTSHLLPEPRLVVGALDGQVSLDSRFAPTATGSVFYREGFEGGWHVTGRYDARRNPLGEGVSNRLPDMTLRWDNSVTRDSTPSLDRLYLRVERRGSHLLYGDFSPSSSSPNRFLQRAGRATGLQSHIRSDYGSLAGYAFQFRWTAVSERLPASGVAGLYYLENAGILPRTEEVWLAAYDRDDDRFVDPISRKRLSRGTDYQIDYSTGTILFSEPVSSYDEFFNRQYIEVTYSVPSVGAGVGAFGVRYALPSGHGVSIAGETGLAADRMTIGLDGRFAIGGAALSYELAGQAATTEHDAGQAAALQITLQPASRLRLNVRAQQIVGEFIRPGEEKALGTGLNVQGQVEWRLSDPWQLRYERDSMLPQTGSERHTDRLRLTYKPSAAISGTATLRSAGADALPWAGDRAVTLGLSGEVRTSERGRLTAQQEYALDAGGLQRAPTSLTYRHQLTESISLAARFEGRLSESKDSAWVFSLESAPQGGPRVYGRFHLPEHDGKVSETVIGMQNRWELRPGLYAGVTVEGIAASDSPQIQAAGSWQLEYVLGTPLRVMWQQERRHTTGGQVGANRLSLDGRTDSGFAYELRASWLLGGERAADGRTYSRELHAQLTYREPETGRAYAAAQVLQRSFATAAQGGFTAKTSDVTVAAVDAGYRIAPGVTVSMKVALKHTSTDWEGNAAGPIGVDLALQQLGAQVQLDSLHSVDLYARRLTDNFGSETAGYGWEIVRMIGDNVGIGVGYSTIGSDDPDVRMVADWREGWYARLRVKF